MTAAKPKTPADTDAKQDETPEVPPLPATGSVVRLDDPEAGGPEQYALVVGERKIIRLGPATAHEIETYSVD